MSETSAIQRWGADGWERCSKTVCGQSADAMVQYYCIHQAGSSMAAGAPPKGEAPAAVATKKSPVSTLIVIIALGCAMLAAAGLRKK